MNSVQIALESILSDIEWMNANNPDPLSVLGGSVDKVLEYWDELNPETRRALLQTAARTFEEAVGLGRPEDIELKERDHALA